MLYVIGHSTYLTITTEYGGCDYSYLFVDKSFVFKAVSKLTSFIYLFHMPLFIALSGALFAKSLSRGSYLSFRELLHKKAKKLVIPFVVVTLFYAVPIKFSSGYFSESTNIVRDILIGQFLLQGNTHLWYLLTLFIIFLVVYLCLTNIKPKEILIFLFFAFLSIFSGKIDIHLVSYVFQYTFWFYAGMLFEGHRLFFENNISNINKLVFFDIVLYAIYEMLGHITLSLSLMIIFKIIKLMLAILLCLTIYMFSYLASINKIIHSKIFNVLRRDSLGIYFYSDPFNYLILSCGVMVFGGDLWTSNLYSAVFYWFRIFFTLVVSIFVTELIRACRIKYIC